MLTEVFMPPNYGFLQFHPYTVTEESPDSEAVQLRMILWWVQQDSNLRPAD